MPYAKLHPLPRLERMWKVIPYDKKNFTFLWDQALPQAFASLDTARDAGKAMQDNRLIKDFVIMSVHQHIDYASFPFTIVKPELN